MELGTLDIKNRIIQTINAELDIDLEKCIENHSVFQNLTANQLKELDKYSYQTEKIIREKINEKELHIFEDLHFSLKYVSSLIRTFIEAESKFKNKTIDQIETFKSKTKKFPITEVDLDLLMNSYNEEEPFYETIDFYNNKDFFDKAVSSISDYRLLEEIGL